MIQQPEFTPTAFERRYRDASIDDSSHSGDSMLALHKVLQAFKIYSDSRSESSAPDEV